MHYTRQKSADTVGDVEDSEHRVRERAGTMSSGLGRESAGGKTVAGSPVQPLRIGWGEHVQAPSFHRYSKVIS